jgi:hypothetical protein
MQHISIIGQNYVTYWKENAVVAAATHGGGALGVMTLHQKQQKLNLQRDASRQKLQLDKEAYQLNQTRLINYDLKKRRINKSQAISQMNSIGVDGVAFFDDDRFVKQKSNTMQKSDSISTKFANLSESVLLNNTEEVIVSVSTSEISDKFNRINRTLNPIAEIGIETKSPISPTSRKSSFLNSSFFWGIIGFVGIAVIQICYLSLQEANIIKKQLSPSQQFELLLENQNKVLTILKQQEKRLEQHEKILEQLQKKL